MDAEYLDRVRAYYDETADMYRKFVGTVLQSGLVTGFDPDPYRSMVRFSTIQAGIRPNDHILDMGSGLCGPSIEICRLFEGATVDAVTISPRQAEIARQLIAQNGMEDRIRVHLRNFHKLEFPDDSFDVALFLETVGYADLPVVFREAKRVLKPGGTLYIKDVFVIERELTAEEQSAIARVNELFVYTMRGIGDYENELLRGGFIVEMAHSINWVSSMTDLRNAMFERSGMEGRLNEFGRRHAALLHRGIPTHFGEIRARKPTA